MLKQHQGSNSLVISIIIAVLNGSSVLERCILGIVNQSYPHWQMIVMDGGSTDGTVDVLCKYDNYISHWESRSDTGIYNAWNKGLEYAEGDWICFLGSDDFFINGGVLANMAEHLHRATVQGMLYAYGKTTILNRRGDVVSVEGRPWEEVKRRLDQLLLITHSGTFHHKKLFQQYGQFDESFKIAGDYEFLLRTLRDKTAYFASDLPVIAFTAGGLSRSLENKYELFQEVLRARNTYFHNFPWLTYWYLMQIKCMTILQKILGHKLTAHLLDTYRELTGKKKLWTIN